MDLPTDIWTHIGGLTDDDVTLVYCSMLSKLLKENMQGMVDARKERKEMLRKGDRYMRLLGIHDTYCSLNLDHYVPDDHAPSGSLSWSRIDNAALHLCIPDRIVPPDPEHTHAWSLIDRLSREYFDLLEAGDTLVHGNLFKLYRNIGKKSAYGRTQAIDTLTGHIFQVRPHRILIPPRTDVLIR
jgi:hypothetical protein